MAILGIHVSSVQNPGWLGYIRDYTTQLYRDYFISHDIRIPINQPGFNGMSTGFGSRCSGVLISTSVNGTVDGINVAPVEAGSLSHYLRRV